MAKLIVSWDTIARSYFRRQIKRIAEDSPQNAEKVRLEILEAIDSIPVNPEKFPPDKFKLNNDGSYRAFEKHSLRIAYYITNHIRILRVRHVRQEPKKY